MESTTVGGRRRRPPYVAEVAEGRLHNAGWGDKWLDKVEYTCLTHFEIVSKTFHQLAPAIYRCLERIMAVNPDANEDDSKFKLAVQ